MSDYSIHRFVEMYKDGTLADDLTYRAYDLESQISHPKAERALKALHYRSGDYGIDLAEFARIKGINNARDVLAMWWVWHRLQKGYLTRAKLRSRDDE